MQLWQYPDIVQFVPEDTFCKPCDVFPVNCLKNQGTAHIMFFQDAFCIFIIGAVFYYKFKLVFCTKLSEKGNHKASLKVQKIALRFLNRSKIDTTLEFNHFGNIRAILGNTMFMTRVRVIPFLP